jgi:hypothetical protein
MKVCLCLPVGPSDALIGTFALVCTGHAGAAVLQIVLQQLPDSWTIKSLCSFMQVSTAFR